MPNGEQINDRLEFQKRIKDMPLEERTSETALMVYDLSHKFDTLSFRGEVSRKTVATTSGITSAVIIGIIEGIKLIVGKG